MVFNTYLCLISDSTTNKSDAKTNRRREGSTDSTAKVKTEPVDMKSLTDAVNTLQSHIDIRDNKDLKVIT